MQIIIDTREATENLRRSIAMMRPGAWALNREDALAILQKLVDTQRAQPPTNE